MILTENREKEKYSFPEGSNAEVTAQMQKPKLKHKKSHSVLRLVQSRDFWKVLWILHSVQVHLREAVFDGPERNVNLLKYFIDR